MQSENTVKKVRIIFIGICFLFANQAFGFHSINTKSRSLAVCPEPDITDWVFINSFLTNPKHNEIREKLGVKKYKISDIQLESNHPKVLKKYLNNKGLKFVSNNTLCDKLAKSLDQSDIKERYKNDFTKKYFQYKNRHLVFYKPNETKLANRSWFVQIVDGNFNVIGDFKVR